MKIDEANEMKKNHTEEDVYILAIESSCDETAAAVVKNGREVLSNIISSQIALHTIYGGVCPRLRRENILKRLTRWWKRLFLKRG